MLETRVDSVGHQVNRISSHIESEIGLARGDMGRIERRLFGEGEDEYGGRIGQLLRRIYKLEMAMFSLVGAAGIILFLFGAYEFIMKFRK